MPPSLRTSILACLAAVYAAGAILGAWNVISHSQASTRAIEKIFQLHSLKNEAAQSLDRYTRRHPILGTLFSGPVQGALDLPSADEASQALHSEVPSLVKTVRREASAAAWWSWFLASLSLLYVATAIALERGFTARGVLFALTCVNLACFVVGVLAPAMIIWTDPTIAVDSDKLHFVLQHEVRGIAAIIHQLLTAGHWIIGGFLLLFSILTPLAKASLTLFVTVSRSRPRNRQVARLLHSIGKWSMADVFVAGVLLALYALKFQEATRSVPCIGLAYFIGYCLLSMTTTQLLTHSEATGPRPPRKSERKWGRRAVAGVYAAALLLAAGAAVYTYWQYPLASREKGAESNLPQKMKAARLAP